MSTHDYVTEFIMPAKLDGTYTLVGESGGLSAVYEVWPSNIMPGFYVVLTEHGSLYMAEEAPVEVYVS